MTSSKMNSLDLLAAMMGWPYYPRNSKSDFKELLSEFDWKLRTELFVFPCGISLFVCELDFEAVHNTRKNDSRSDPPSDYKINGRTTMLLNVQMLDIERWYWRRVQEAERVL